MNRVKGPTSKIPNNNTFRTIAELKEVKEGQTCFRTKKVLISEINEEPTATTSKTAKAMLVCAGRGRLREARIRRKDVITRHGRTCRCKRKRHDN